MRDAVDLGATGGMHQVMPFTRKLDVEATSVQPDEVRARLVWSEDVCTTGGVMHGGAIMSLADSTGALCAFLNLPEGAAGTSTIESKTNFLRAVRSGHAEAISRPLHTGKTIVVIETDVVDADGRLCARVTQSQAVLRAETS